MAVVWLLGEVSEPSLSWTLISRGVVMGFSLL